MKTRTIAAILGLALRVVLAGMMADFADADPGADLRGTDEASECPAAVRGTVAKLPVSFIANAGQTDPAVRFLVNGAGQTIFFTPDEVVLRSAQRTEGERAASAVVRLRFAEANSAPVIEGLDRLSGVANFFLGNDPAKWRTNVRTYGKVIYRQLYPGIDLVYRGTDGRLKREFIVAPGTDPDQIRMEYRGAQHLKLGQEGALVVSTELGKWIEEAPLIYQEIAGRRVEVAGGYRLLESGQVGFRIGRYDRAYPLVIDPTLIYSTYLGGSSDDRGYGIAVDAWGSAYIIGITDSANFPTAGAAYDKSHNGKTDIFVTMLNPAGSNLAYSTFIGGSGRDWGEGIAIDGKGNAYITGYTASANFPTTAGAYDRFHNGKQDAFVARLDAAGSKLVCSTFIGGSGYDGGNDIAIDDTGNAYITGYTESTDFPTTAGAYDRSFNSAGPASFGYDVFVTKLDPMGSKLVYSTYIGSDKDEEGNGIAVDSSGSAYVTGKYFVGSYYGSYSKIRFPVTAGAFDTTHHWGADAFVVKLHPAGSDLLYSTFLGGKKQDITLAGSGWDTGHDIAVDASGNAYITGRTCCIDFPTTSGALDTTYNGNIDAFMTKLGPKGSKLIYSTYIGGKKDDFGWGIALHGSGSAYITGLTESADFPTTSGAYDTSHNGKQDAFVAKLHPAGTTLFCSTFLGGGDHDSGGGIAVDSSGDAYVTGLTYSANFSTENPIQLYKKGKNDAFVAKLDFASPIAPGNLTATGVTESEIALNWVDKSNDEDGFMIERNVYKGYYGGYSLIATVAANTTSYSDKGLVACTGACYRVRAYNAKGYSLYSNESCGSGRCVIKRPVWLQGCVLCDYHLIPDFLSHLSVVATTVDELGSSVGETPLVEQMVAEAGDFQGALDAFLESPDAEAGGEVMTILFDTFAGLYESFVALREEVGPIPPIISRLDEQIQRLGLLLGGLEGAVNEFLTAPVVFSDDFEDGIADGWELEPGWQVRQEGGNHVLSGEGHSWARLLSGEDWTDYALRCHVMLMAGSVHLNYRVGDEGRYFVAFREGGLDLFKAAPWGNLVLLAASDTHHSREVWYDVKIVGKNGYLQVYVDNSLEIEFIDAVPLTQGSVAFETVEGSHAHIDNVEAILYEDAFAIYQCTLAYDLNHDCVVNSLDLALLASEWLECGNPFDPYCQP